MKRLIVMRHAKSSWDDPALDDFDRPLNGRGKLAAPYMGALMRSKGLVPDVIVASPAKRARKTAKKARKAGEFAAPVTYEPGVYEASTGTLVDILSKVEDTNHTVLLVGHNPGMEGLVGYLTGTSAAMPTAAVAVLELTVDSWGQIDRDTGHLKALFRPTEEMKAD